MDLTSGNSHLRMHLAANRDNEAHRETPTYMTGYHCLSLIESLTQLQLI